MNNKCKINHFLLIDGFPFKDAELSKGKQFENVKNHETFVKIKKKSTREFERVEEIQERCLE